MRAKWHILGVLGLCGLGLGIVRVVDSTDGSGQRGDIDVPVKVQIAQAQIADVPVHLDGVGTTKSVSTATIRSQVDGRLIRIDFRDGQDVKRGDLLAQVDPTTYQAQLDQAIAKKAQSEVQRANAKLDLDRYARLVTNNSVSRQQVDTQQALVAQLEAQVKLDQAAIDIAQAHLGYTTITSPLDGRVGIRRVDEGNIVQASDPEGIVVVTRFQPISVLFNLPQQRLTQVNRALARRPIPAEVLDGGTRAVIDRGTLRVVDNRVDASTGTVKIKAEFPNAELKLWPGQFVDIRLLIDTLQDVVVIPIAAVQQGPNGAFVYLVQSDRTVAVRPVNVSQQDADQAVIATGLAAADRVVTSGFSQLSDGRRVSIADSEDAGRPGSSDAAPVPLADRGESRRREPGGRSDARSGTTQ